MIMKHKLNVSDIIFVLGSNDYKVAEYASDLFLKGLAPYILFSGGIAHHDDLLSTGWNKAEAEIFADIAISKGIPKDRIIIENKAKNTGENVLYTEKILKKAGIIFSNVIAVQKPYMERRTFATIKVHWPNVNLMVSSPPIDFEDYVSNNKDKECLINIMVGDLQRIIEYPKLGFQIEQKVPNEVLNAYHFLVGKGYDKHLINPKKK